MGGLQLVRSLAQRVQPGQRAPRQGTAEAVQPRRLELEHRDGPLRVALCESQLTFDVVTGQRPGEELGRPYSADEQHPARRRPSKERRPVGAANRPTCAFREAPTVRTDTGDPRPPVWKVMRLGDEFPDVLPRGEQLE